jgi:hypothetical protein
MEAKPICEWAAERICSYRLTHDRACAWNIAAFCAILSPTALFSLAKIEYPRRQSAKMRAV